MKSDFPRVLSLLRKEKGISQKEAANQLGVSQALLSHYEKGIRECGLTVFRWPGGCCAEKYHWQDGIGPNRLPRMHYCTTDTNNGIWDMSFGTDECIEFCRLCGMEPMFVCNVSTGTAEEFRAWFEYCKPFGWEVHDIRYGGLIMRFDTVKERLNTYLNGDINAIDELEADRLSFDGSAEGSNIGESFLWYPYRNIASAGIL